MLGQDIQINKIVDNFKLENESKAKNHKSKHWKKYYKSAEKFLDPENIKNFRNKAILSEGLDDSSANYVKESNLLYYILDEIDNNFIENNLLESNIGNSDTVKKFLDKYLDFHLLIQIKWLWDLQNKIQLKEFKSCLEIGGGYGSFANLMIKNYNIKYILIDLPETNIQSTYFLSQLHKDKKFLLSSFLNKKNFLSFEEFEKNDIIIINPDTKFDKKIRFDLCINCRSMMEMDYKEIKNYFILIEKKLKDFGYFLNINQYSKSTTGEDIRISKYPYDDKWRIVDSKNCIYQPNLHYLLAQRSNQENVNPGEMFSNVKNFLITREKQFLFKTINRYQKFNKIRLLIKFFKLNKIFKKLSGLLKYLSS